MLHVIIPGVPIPLQRPKLSKHRFYDPQESKKEDVFWIVRKQVPQGLHLLKVPVHISFAFFMPIPKYKKRKIKENDPHFCRPDLDNLIKFYCDACQEILFDDDAQIYSIAATKVYSTNPRTTLTIQGYEHA